MPELRCYFLCVYVNIATISKAAFTIKVNSSYVVIRNCLLSVRLGNRDVSHPDDFLGKYTIFSKFRCCDVAMFRPVGNWAVLLN
nr:MAG TPA: hypothetical protein [Caudoviricetes sp.]